MADELPRELLLRLMQGMPRNTSAPMPNYAMSGAQPNSAMPVHGLGAQTGGIPNPAIPARAEGGPMPAPFGSMMPYGGLKNAPLPPFEMPGMSAQYMPQPSALPGFVPPGGSSQYMPPMGAPRPQGMAPQPQPQQAPQNPPQALAQQMQPAPAAQAPPQIDPEILRRLALEEWRNKAAPWTVNEGNYRDQRGG